MKLTPAAVADIRRRRGGRMKPTLIDRVIDRAVVPVVAMCVVLPLLAVWHFAAERENQRRGRR